MEAVRASETSVTFYRTKRPDVPGHTDIEVFILEFFQHIAEYLALRSVTEAFHTRVFTALQKYRLMFSGTDTVYSGTRCASITFHWGGVILGLNIITLIVEAILQKSCPQYNCNTTPSAAAFVYTQIQLLHSKFAHLTPIKTSNPLGFLVSSNTSYVFVFHFSKFQSTSYSLDYIVLLRLKIPRKSGKTFDIIVSRTSGFI